MKHAVPFQLLLAALALAAPAAAQSVSVTAASPNNAPQGTVSLDVAISGKGFKKGANTKFVVSGTTDPGGVTVNSTTFVGVTQLSANITVAGTATVAGFDVAVSNPDGGSGKGTDVFSVINGSNGAVAKCSPGPLPAGVTLAATFNSMTGTPVYQGLLGKTVRGRLTTVLGRSVVLAAAGAGNSVVDVFFLDPVTGAVLDGTWGQPHLQMPTPVGSHYAMVIADVNNDGIPDLVLGARDAALAWVYLGQGGGAGTFSFSPYITLVTPTPNSGFGASIAVGDLNGDGVNEIALGVVSGGTGKRIIPALVALYRFNGSGFTNYATISQPSTNNSAFAAVVAIGDVTGDGLADLIVGADGSSTVWIYPGSAAGLLNPISITNGSNGMGNAIGVAQLTGASGGYSDLLAVEHFTVSNPRGLVFGGPVANHANPTFTLAPVEIDWPNSALDFADLNNDGLSDIVFGAESTGCSGSAYIYRSGTSGYQSTVIAGPLSAASNVGYGSAVSAVPGTNIVLVGDKWWTGPSGIQSGQVYVYIVN